MKLRCLTFLLLLSTISLHAQSAEIRRPGELLVCLQGDADVPAVVQWVERQTGVRMELRRTVAASWRIYLLSFDEAAAGAPERVLEAARRFPGARAAQWNHAAAERNVEPNDPEWGLQDDMRQIGADDAWIASTGGATPDGHTVVVAVLEKGIKRDHPDLAPNIWVNAAEMPDDSIDNDGNGYVDDYLGWDARNDGDGPGNPVNNHGTGVTGIIGARGDNSQGIAGVNWAVQLMTITNVEFEDEIIAAHEYVAKMRRRYNESNGTAGAFVVALNASFGINKARAEDHPLWCGMYDELGEAGVLGVGATTNSNIDVDNEGDMPTSCPSEFLIAVNNVTPLDVRASSTGTGRESIDLGAPGNGTYTTSSGSSGYGTLDGTSSATPHVTGAVALLYSMPCGKFSSDALTNPMQCARRVRDMIFATVTPLPSLENFTKTGARLDLRESTNRVRELCDGSIGALDITLLRPSGGRGLVVVEYETPDFGKYAFRIFNALGQLVHEEAVNPPQFGVKSLVIDVDFLAPGVYTFTLARGRSITAEKFVKI